MIEPVLNELSLEPAPLPTIVRVNSLLDVIKKLDTLGFPRLIRQTREALLRDIEDGLSFRAWLFQKASRDLRQFLAGRLEKAPYVEQLHRNQEDARRSLLQAFCGDDEAIGAGVAHLHDAPTIALRGKPRWEADPLAVRLTRIDEETGTLVEMPVEIIHLCRPEQIDGREKSLRDRILLTVSGGADLWKRRLELFQRLDFCDGVERQLLALTGKEFYFQLVVLALSRLDAALAGWNSGPLQPGMDSSGESQSTLDHGTYGPMRNFICIDGQERRFSRHLKLFPNNWRIYYWETRVEKAGGRAHIGYVGAHLPTVNYPT